MHRELELMCKSESNSTVMPNLLNLLIHPSICQLIFLCKFPLSIYKSQTYYFIMTKIVIFFNHVFVQVLLIF